MKYFIKLEKTSALAKELHEAQELPIVASSKYFLFKKAELDVKYAPHLDSSADDGVDDATVIGTFLQENK